MTRHWTIENNTPSPSQLDEIAAALMSGAVVLMPTDTIYGLHALASSDEAVDRIVEIKGRDETKPLIVLASSVEQIHDAGVTLDPKTESALSSIWPAPLTVILRLTAPLAASRGASTIAVRIPAVEWLRELIERTGPLASTSANRSGEPVIDRPSALARDLQNRIDAIADAGVLGGEASAILDLSGATPRFIRERGDLFTQEVWKTLRKTL